MRYTFTSLLLFASGLLFGQFMVYKTLDDLRNETPWVLDGYEFVTIQSEDNDARIVIKHVETKEKLTIECKDIWGLSFKDRLFRVIKDSKYYKEGKRRNIPVMLIAEKNGMFLWGNGDFMEMLEKPKRDFFILDPLYTGFMCRGIDGEVLMLSGQEKTLKWMQEQGRRFFRDHEELNVAIPCLSTKWNGKPRPAEEFMDKYDEVKQCFFDQ